MPVTANTLDADSVVVTHADQERLAFTHRDVDGELILVRSPRRRRGYLLRLGGRAVKRATPATAAIFDLCDRVARNVGMVRS